MERSKPALESQPPQHLPEVPTISSDEELLDELAEKNDDETNVDETDQDESGTPMKISNGEDG